jgi:hypothetical protein
LSVQEAAVSIKNPPRDHRRAGKISCRSTGGTVRRLLAVLALIHFLSRTVTVVWIFLSVPMVGYKTLLLCNRV